MVAELKCHPSQRDFQQSIAGIVDVDGVFASQVDCACRRCVHHELARAGPDQRVQLAVLQQHLAIGGGAQFRIGTDQHGAELVGPQSHLGVTAGAHHLPGAEGHGHGGLPTSQTGLPLDAIHLPRGGGGRRSAKLQCHSSSYYDCRRG